MVSPTWAKQTAQKSRLLVLGVENLKAGIFSSVTRNTHCLAMTPPQWWVTVSSRSGLVARWMQHGPARGQQGQSYGSTLAYPMHVKRTELSPHTFSPPGLLLRDLTAQGALVPQAGRCRPSSQNRLLCTHQIRRHFTPSHREVNVRYQFLPWLSFPVLHACVCMFKR